MKPTRPLIECLVLDDHARPHADYVLDERPRSLTACVIHDDHPRSAAALAAFLDWLWTPLFCGLVIGGGLTGLYYLATL